MKQTPPTGTGTPQELPPALTVHGAVSAFDAFLAPPQADKPEGDEEQPGAEAQAESGEQGEQPGDEQEAGDEATGSTDEESGEEAAESEEQPSDDEEQGEDPKADQTFTVRIDGKDEKVTQSELIAGYSRTADYTRKTQALSTERKAFVAEQEIVRAERQEYQNLLPQVRAMLEQGPGAKKPDPALRESDPQAYLLQKAAYDEHQQAMAAVQHQERLAAERQQRDFEEQRKRVVIEQNNKLLEKLPSWRDEKVADKEGEQIVEVLKSVGFSGKELEIFDHRAILVARMAAQFMQSQKKREQVAPKLKNAPVVKPGAATRTPSEGQRAKAERSRFNKSGSVRDAVPIFERFLK